MDLVGRPTRHAAPTGRSAGGGWFHALIFGLYLGLVGTAGAATTFEAQGRVAEVDASRSAVTLEHGRIPGLLPAARSQFPVSSAELIERIRPGDRVRFTLTAADDSHGLLTVTSLAPEPTGSPTALDRFVPLVAMALGLLALTTSVVVGAVLWRSLQGLHRRTIALDNETGMLRGDVADTQDAVRQIARALEDAATTFRVGYVRDLRRRLVPLSTSRPSEDATSNGADHALVVVQRGRGELFRAVESGAVGPGCTAMWDRRRGDRRSGGRRTVTHERRQGERRAVLPDSWTRLGFHVVPRGDAGPPRGLHPLRSAGGEHGVAH